MRTLQQIQRDENVGYHIASKIQAAESLSPQSACLEAIRTAVVLAEREMIPGPKLIDEWKQMLPNAPRDPRGDSRVGVHAVVRKESA